MTDILFRLKNLSGMLRNLRKSREVISGLQNDKFLNLVTHAFKNVPFYRKKIRSAGIDLTDIRGIADIHKIPFTSKQELRQSTGNDAIARGTVFSRCTRYVTSGTSGQPLSIYFSPRDETVINMTWIRAFLASGMSPFHRLAAFIGRENSGRKPAWHEYLGVFRRKEVSNWLTPAHWIREFQSFRPQAIIGDIISLRLLTETIREQGITGISPGLIFNTSILLDPHSRRYLEDHYQCPVVDLYGAFEGGCLAWECSRCGGYHINSDTAVVEVLNQGQPVNPGEAGEVFLTNLHSYAMPFIRYGLGDQVILSERKPVCGTSFPLLEGIIGRMDDYILLRNGKKVACQPFYHILNPVSGIRRWRVIQERPDHLTVLILPGPDFQPNCISDISDQIKRVVEDQLQLEVRVVAAIDHDPGYKYRSVITLAGGIFNQKNG